MMDENLERYLNDHLAGSSGAVDLIAAIAEASDDPARAEFFHRLRGQVEEDREVLRGLLADIGQSGSAALQVVGSLTEKVGRIKLWWEGFQPGELGMFEAMEMLALGIQGKHLLWQALEEIKPWFPEWGSVDFAALKNEAVRQRDAVEEYRIQAGIAALVDECRRKD